jgi:hypothetical protein
MQLAVAPFAHLVYRAVTTNDEVQQEHEQQQRRIFTAETVIL